MCKGVIVERRRTERDAGRDEKCEDWQGILLGASVRDAISVAIDSRRAQTSRSEGNTSRGRKRQMCYSAIRAQVCRGPRCVDRYYARSKREVVDPTEHQASPRLRSPPADNKLQKRLSCFFPVPFVSASKVSTQNRFLLHFKLFLY